MVRIDEVYQFCHGKLRQCLFYVERLRLDDRLIGEPTREGTQRIHAFHYLDVTGGKG